MIFYILPMLAMLSCGNQGNANSFAKNIRSSEDAQLIKNLEDQIEILKKDIKNLNILINRVKNGEEGDTNRTIYELGEQILSKDKIIEISSEEYKVHKLKILELEERNIKLIKELERISSI